MLEKVFHIEELTKQEREDINKLKKDFETFRINTTATLKEVLKILPEDIKKTKIHYQIK